MAGWQGAADSQAEEFEEVFDPAHVA
eukprot:COSAG01_NODE_71656_length_255_cov_0.666667_2_plen_25_part_01